MQDAHQALAHPRRNALLCCLALGICVLLINPRVQMGVDDDWSYTKSAFDFARTGHILYNGWATAMLGWQIIWGGFFVKVFGYSFTAVRLSMLPIAMGSVYLLHQILIRFGANAWNAAIGALTMALSPLFLPLTTSFMTDVPGVFSVLLCLYMCQRALQAPTRRSAVAWLCTAAAVNVVGGTVRQIVWFGALTMVPVTAWLLRKRYRLWRVTAVLWVLSCVGVASFVYWFRQQPYSVPEKLLEGAIGTGQILSVAIRLVSFSLTLVMFMLPILVASVSAMRRLPLWDRILGYVLMAVGSIALLVFTIHRPLDRFLAPWMLNVVSRYGMFFVADLGPSPFITDSDPSIFAMARWVRIAVTMLVGLSIVGCAVVALSRCRSRTGESSRSYGSLALTVSFLVPYVASLLPRATFGAQYVLLDRYALPILPLLIIVLILYYQERISERLPWVCVIVLVVFAVYGVAATHDFFSMDRARHAAAERIERTGVPRTAIHGSFEYDAWTQLQAEGHVNEKKVEVPAGAYRAATHHHQPPANCQFFYADFIPAVRPKFLVVLKPRLCLANSDLAPVEYHTWQPPFQREVYIQKQMAGYDWID